MRPRHALPTLWLMTDERMGELLLPAIAALPRGAGVVFRYLATPRSERTALFRAVRAIARARRLVLLVAGERVGRADGVYVSADASGKPFVPNGVGLRAASVHDARELTAARRGGADLVFVSPVCATRTHPGVSALGRVRFAALATRAHAPVIALGGMTAARFRGLPAHGWAAIDGLTCSSSRGAKRRGDPGRRTQS